LLQRVVTLALGVVLVCNNGFWALFGGSVFWVWMEVLVAPAMALVVVCCSGDNIGGGDSIWCFGCCREWLVLWIF
jgi:hypothetical protein